MSGTTRRAFARMLGLAPVAAKAAADKVLASAGIGAFDQPSPSNAGPPMVGGGGSHERWVERELQKFAKRRALASTVGIPESVTWAMREQAKHIGALDVDLAAMVSMSPAAKIAHQRERNFGRHQDRLLNGNPWSMVDMLTGSDEVWR